MFRTRRLKHRQEQSKKHDSLPLLETTDESSATTRRKEKSSWDEDVIIDKGNDNGNGSGKKKLMVKIRSTDRRRLVSKRSHQQKNIPLHSTSLSTDPSKTASTDSSENSTSNDSQTSHKSLRILYSEKWAEKDALTNHFGKKSKSMINKPSRSPLVTQNSSSSFVQSTDSENDPIFNDHFAKRESNRRNTKNGFSLRKPIQSPLVTQNSSTSFIPSTDSENDTILNNLFCPRDSKSFSDKGKESDCDKGNIVSSSEEGISFSEDTYDRGERTEDDSSSYHDLISEAVALRLKEDKAKSKNEARNQIPLVINSYNIQPKQRGNNQFTEECFDDSSECFKVIKSLKSSETVKEAIYSKHIPTTSNYTPLVGHRPNKPTNAPASHKKKAILNHRPNSILDSNKLEGTRSSEIVHRGRLAKCSQVESRSKFNRKEVINKSESNDGSESEIETSVLDDYEASDNNIVSICLLDLNGNNVDASTRLKTGLVTSGRQNSQSDREYLVRMGFTTDEYGYIVLENIDRNDDETEDIQVWKAMVPIDTETDIDNRIFLPSDDAQDVKDQATTLLMNGEFDQVSELLRTHLPTDEPQSGVITQVNIGSIQLWQGDYVGAIESFEAAATEMDENTPRQARTLALLGMALYGDKKFEEANQAYLRSLTMLRTRKEGYGCYNLRHEFVMGQIFNCVGCSFYETGFHKSASRSFLNALHVYLQDIVDADMTTEESQSVEFVLTRVKENKNWTSHIPPPFVLDTAISFANLACVLINRNSLNQAISCLRLSLKLQMSADESTVNKETMIATLEKLGNTYIKHQNLKDAEHVFEIVLRTGRDKFTDTYMFHQTMVRASIVMQKLKLELKDTEQASKYTELADYHQSAALDSIKVQSMPQKAVTVKTEYSESDSEFSDDITPLPSSTSEESDISEDYHHSLSFE